MNPSNDIRICISPSQGKIIIEEQDGPVTTRKEVDQHPDQLLQKQPADR